MTNQLSQAALSLLAQQLCDCSHLNLSVFSVMHCSHNEVIHPYDNIDLNPLIQMSTAESLNPRKVELLRKTVNATKDFLFRYVDWHTCRSIPTYIQTLVYWLLFIYGEHLVTLPNKAFVLFFLIFHFLMHRSEMAALLKRGKTLISWAHHRRAPAIPSSHVSRYKQCNT